MSAPSRPVFVAHRGEAARYPENTVAAILAAQRSGINHIEFDIQLSADRVAVLAHDASLLRTAGVDRLVSATVAAELQQINVGEPQRFGAAFAHETIPTLERLLQALPPQPALTLFVELKRHSLEAFGRRRVLSATLPLLEGCPHEVVLISFDAPVLHMARKLCDGAIGWVLSAYDNDSLARLRDLGAEFVFCNKQRLPGSGGLWQGSWQWVIYEITTAAEVVSLGARGAHYFESMRASELQLNWSKLRA